ncbi:MAG TPA: transcriptional regulator [Clostridiales bacterium]|nr:transcriptional regulator [Clostridiales bacterium]
MIVRERSKRLQLTPDPCHLPVYKALASRTRLRILKLLAEGDLNAGKIASRLGMSPAMATRHLDLLQQAGLISTRSLPCKGGIQRVCTLLPDILTLDLTLKPENPGRHRVISIPPGHYTDWEIRPPCGLATPQGILGRFDDPRVFEHPEHTKARILWFGSGYIQYRMHILTVKPEDLEAVEISMELGSEAPGVSSTWLSDIHFFLNGIPLGKWTCPGDFAAKRGRYSPAWWSGGLCQYGILKVLRVDRKGTFLEGTPLSEVTLSDLHPGTPFWHFRLEVPWQAEHVGGINILGRGFGNYDQDIRVDIFER